MPLRRAIELLDRESLINILNYIAEQFPIIKRQLIGMLNDKEIEYGRRKQ